VVDGGGFEEKIRQTMESEMFSFDQMQCVYQRANTGGRLDGPLVKVGLKSIHVTCKACHHAWIASKTGAGKFTEGTNVVAFKCPGCEASEMTQKGKFLSN